MGEFPRGALTVRVKRGEEPPFLVECDALDTVFSLKESIAAITGIYPSQQRLVFAGKALTDEFSLDFYRIRDSSLVYLVPTPGCRVRQKPYRLLNRLVSLIEELPTADSLRHTDVVGEVTSIVEDPTVQGVARIDSDVRRLLDDANDVVSSTERPISRRTKDFLARTQDVIMDQFDASPESFRLMKTLIDESDEEDFEDPLKTTTMFHRRIQEKPLPNPWTEKRHSNVFMESALRLSVPALLGEGKKENATCTKRPTFEYGFNVKLKTKFRRQLATLKNMGFNDENVILQALTETNGNVQMAVKLLRNRFYMT